MKLQDADRVERTLMVLPVARGLTDGLRPSFRAEFVGRLFADYLAGASWADQQLLIAVGYPQICEWPAGVERDDDNYECWGQSYARLVIT